jgi:site-specific recombinase XerD
MSTKDLIEINNSDWRAWFLYRKNKSNSPRSISRGLSALKSFFSFLIDEKIIKSHEILISKPPKISKKLPRPLQSGQIIEILKEFSSIKQTDWVVHRDKAILVLIYSVGLRISEALNLKLSDLSSRNGFIEIVGKGGKAREVPLLNDVRDVIDGYLEKIPFKIQNPSKERYLFLNKFGDRLSASSVQKIVKESRRILNFSENITPHSFRHSCASHIMEKSGDIRGIQELLGHSRLTSTQIYTEISRKYLTEVYDKFHPFSRKKSTITSED